MIFFFNDFSLIIFYHSVWLGFELFGLRVQGHSHWVQFTLTRKGYDNRHYHNKPQTGNGAGVWMTSCPEEMGWEFGRFWKRYSWSPAMVLRNWGPTMVLRSRSPTMQLRNWDWMMQADNWVSAIGAEKCHWVEFSTIAAAVKFFGSRPVKMNWDLKNHEKCRMLGVLLAEYDYF